jgi:hypothetical protein
MNLGFENHLFFEALNGSIRSERINNLRFERNR